jgi:hypothetical protein
VPLLVNSLPIGAVCARAVPSGTAAKVSVAMDKSAHLEKYVLATIGVSPVIKSDRHIASLPVIRMELTGFFLGVSIRRTFG